VSVSSSQINLNWTDQSNNETGFQIERKTGVGGTYSQIGTVGANVTTYSDTGLTAGTTFVYRVRSFNAGWNSSYSNDVIATTPTSCSDGGGGGGGGGCSVSPMGKSDEQTTMGTILALLSPALILAIRKIVCGGYDRV
jgi:hypothetical protein